MLGPCRIFLNVEIARFATNKLQQVADVDDQKAAFVVLSDI